VYNITQAAVTGPQQGFSHNVHVTAMQKVSKLLLLQHNNYHSTY